MDREKQIEFYRVAPTNLLLDLTDKLEGLEPELIPLLQNELYRRNEEMAGAKINAYLRNPNFSLNVEDIREEMHLRLRDGEDLDNIRNDIKERLGDYYQFIKEYFEGEEGYIEIDEFQENIDAVEIKKETDSVIEQIKDDLIQQGISEEIADSLSLKNKDEIKIYVEEMVQKARRRGTRDLILGFVFLIAGIVVTATSSHIIYYGGIIAGLGFIINGIRLKSIKMPVKE
ncbi:MAG: hypothetical protein JXB49_35990 [Bacteroidales bacterium]|nr:hypothetical protein [Bacteroidales bacterium]